MSVKIVDAKQGAVTNTINGTITKTDLDKMEKDFATDAKIVAQNSRTIIQQKEFYFYKAQLQELLNKSADDALIVKISLGVQLPDIKSCKDTDIGNNIGAIIEMVKLTLNESGTEIATLAPQNNVNDSILIDGFATPTKAMFGSTFSLSINQTGCCPHTGIIGHPSTGG